MNPCPMCKRDIEPSALNKYNGLCPACEYDRCIASAAAAYGEPPRHLRDSVDHSGLSACSITPPPDGKLWRR